MVKTLTIRDDVYRKLLALKKENESFSKVIDRLISEKRNKSLKILKKYSGSLKDSNLEEIILKERKKFRVRFFDI